MLQGNRNVFSSKLRMSQVCNSYWNKLIGDMNVRLPAVISHIISLSLKTPTQLLSEQIRTNPHILSEQIHNKLEQATYTKAGMEDGAGLINRTALSAIVTVCVWGGGGGGGGGDMHATYLQLS